MKYSLPILAILIGIIACPVTLIGQRRSDKLQPKWMHTLPESKSGTYIFVSASGEGATLQNARQSAFVAMTEKIEQSRGLTVNSKIQVSESFSQRESDSSTGYHQEIVLEVIEKGRKMNVVCREVDEYWRKQSGKYIMYVLYAVTNTNSGGGSYNDDITVSSNYGAAGLLSVIPGMGQIYKGSKFKGYAIIGGEVAAVGGLLLCENTRSSYIKKMKEQPKYAAEYNSRADTWETMRNLCIGAAAAIYVYNLIDALAATGAKHVIVRGNNSTLSAVPYVDNQSVGFGIALNF